MLRSHELERLWRVRAFFDLYDAAVQLGVLPAHGGMGERALMLLRDGASLTITTRFPHDAVRP